MASGAIAINNIHLYTDYKFTQLELAFLACYLSNGGNGTQAAKDAGMKCKSDMAYAKRASDLLRTEKFRKELAAQLQAIQDAKIADATEILQFYTSVMRGEVLDQFGIEASLDTRIKAANELAKHKIEIPLKLQQKELSNNVGSITLNFLPRKKEDDTENTES